MPEDQGQQALFLTIHHLVIDLVSWRIILQELEDLLRKSLGILDQLQRWEVGRAMLGFAFSMLWVDEQLGRLEMSR